MWKPLEHKEFSCYILCCVLKCFSFRAIFINFDTYQIKCLWWNEPAAVYSLKMFLAVIGSHKIYYYINLHPGRNLFSPLSTRASALLFCCLAWLVSSLAWLIGNELCSLCVHSLVKPRQSLWEFSSRRKPLTLFSPNYEGTENMFYFLIVSYRGWEFGVSWEFFCNQSNGYIHEDDWRNGELKCCRSFILCMRSSSICKYLQWLKWPFFRWH